MPDIPDVFLDFVWLFFVAFDSVLEMPCVFDE